MDAQQLVALKRYEEAHAVLLQALSAIAAAASPSFSSSPFPSPSPPPSLLPPSSSAQPSSISTTVLPPSPFPSSASHRPRCRGRDCECLPFVILLLQVLHEQGMWRDALPFLEQWYAEADHHHEGQRAQQSRAGGRQQPLAMPHIVTNVLVLLFAENDALEEARCLMAPRIDALLHLLPMPALLPALPDHPSSHHPHPDLLHHPPAATSPSASPSENFDVRPAAFDQQYSTPSTHPTPPAIKARASSSPSQIGGSENLSSTPSTPSASAATSASHPALTTPSLSIPSAPPSARFSLGPPEEALLLLEVYLRRILVVCDDSAASESQFRALAARLGGVHEQDCLAALEDARHHRGDRGGGRGKSSPSSSPSRGRSGEGLSQSDAAPAESQRPASWSSTIASAPQNIFRAVVELFRHLTRWKYWSQLAQGLGGVPRKVFGGFTAAAAGAAAGALVLLFLLAARRGRRKGEARLLPVTATIGMSGQGGRTSHSSVT